MFNRSRIVRSKEWKKSKFSLYPMPRLLSEQSRLQARDTDLCVFEIDELNACRRTLVATESGHINNTIFNHIEDCSRLVSDIMLKLLVRLIHYFKICV